MNMLFYLILVAHPSLHFLMIIKRFERFNEANWDDVNRVQIVWCLNEWSLYCSQGNDSIGWNLVMSTFLPFIISQIYVMMKNWIDLVGCMDQSQMEVWFNLCCFVFFLIQSDWLDSSSWLCAFETRKAIQTTGPHWKWWNTSAVVRRAFSSL